MKWKTYIFETFKIPNIKGLKFKKFKIGVERIKP